MNPTETEPILRDPSSAREPPPSYLRAASLPQTPPSQGFQFFNWAASAWKKATAKDKDQEKIQRRKSKVGYDWKTFRPQDNSWWHHFRWFIKGGANFADVSDDLLYEELQQLARCLVLLRSYHTRFGMPINGDIRDQEWTLRECVKDMYAGGAPLWSLESIMSKVSQGLTGNPYVNWFFLPRKAFVFAPSGSATTLFSMARGFAIYKLDDIETVTVRLVSFASNTRGTSNIPSRFPYPHELQSTAQAQEQRFGYEPELSQEELAEAILDMASQGQGIFYFINAPGYQQCIQDEDLRAFWTVTDSEREVFSRLACREAMDTIQEIDAGKKRALYPPLVIVLFRMVAAAGACIFWFQGSWYDMVVAACMAVLVALIGEWSALSKQEKLIFEVIASFIVGLTAGFVALIWPQQTCFGAMALSGIMDLMQGFRVVYAIIEVMSRNSVAGTSDLMEGLMFTGLVAYGMRSGQVLAASILRGEGYTKFHQCNNSVSHIWYIPFVPMAALAWSGLFTPNYQDLPFMAAHGVLGYGMNYLLSMCGLGDNINNFLSAMSVSFSSGILSRFTGRQAIACTVAGLYVLLPGAYLVTSLFSTEVDNQFFVQIVQRAVVIGIGAWTGSMLCSPTLLGSTGGILSQFGTESKNRDNDWKTHTMLFF